MEVKLELMFWRSMDIRKQLLVGYYGYGKRGRKYNEVQEALSEVRRMLNTLRSWSWSERDIPLDFNEMRNVW